MANDTIDINDDNNLGRLVGNPGEVMSVDLPGMEDAKNLGVEDENRDIENPGVEDVENLGMEDDRAVENQDIASKENEKSETVTNDQESMENEGVDNENQGFQENESKFNLRRNRAQSYKHIYKPEVYDTEISKDNEQHEAMMTTIDDVPRNPTNVNEKGFKSIW